MRGEEFSIGIRSLHHYQVILKFFYTYLDPYLTPVFYK